MAQQLEIVVKVREAGQRVLQTLIDKVKELGRAVETANISSPIAKISQAADTAAQSFERMEDSIGNIEGTFRDVISSIVGQTRDFAASTIGRIAQSFEQATETFYARVTTLTLIFTSAVGASFIGLQGTVGSFVAEFSTQIFSLTPIVGFISDKLQLLPRLIGGFVRPTVSFLNMLTKSATGFLGVIGALGTGILGFFTVKVALSETIVLVRRLIGHGEKALTPLERLTRMIITIDEGITAIGLNLGSVLKTATFGVLTFLGGPFAGIVSGLPFINSLITSLMQVLHRGRLKFFAALGSSRAQVVLIFFELKRLVLGAIPLFQQFIGGFKGLQKDAARAGKELKKMGDSVSPERLEGLKALSRMKLPFVKQFQLAFAEVRVLLVEMLRKINEIFIVIQKGIGLSRREIEGVRQEASGALSEVALKTRDITSVIEEQIGFWRRLGRIITAPFRLVFGFVRGIWNFARGLGSIILMPFKSLSEKFKRTRVEKTAAKESEREAIAERKRIDQLIRKLLDLRKVKDDIAKRPLTVGLGKGVAGQFEAFLRVLRDYKEGTIDAKEALGRLAVVLEKLIALGKKFNTITDQEVIELGRVVQALRVFSGEARISPAIMKDFERLEQSIALLRKQLGEEPKTTFTTLVSKGIKKDVKEAEKASGLFAKILGALIPLDVFKKVAQSGKKIAKQLAAGMAAGKSALRKASEENAEAIAKYFPRSLPQAGPLRQTLTRGGRLIAVLLARSMRTGIGAVRSASNAIALAIVNPVRLVISRFGTNVLSDLSDVISKGAETALFATRLGISTEKVRALQFAIAGVGGTLGELSYALQRVNSAISEALASEETRAKLEAFGIDVERISRSGDPTIAMLLKISEIVSKLPPGSKRAAEALALIGVLPASKIADFIRLGPDRIRESLKLAVDAGVAFDAKFSQTALNLRTHFSRFALVIESIKRDFLLFVLPAIIEKAKQIFDLIKENRVKIQVFFAIIGRAISILIESSVKLAEFIFKNPAKALSALQGVLVSFIRFVLNISGTLFNLIGKQAFSFVVYLIPLLQRFIKGKLVEFGIGLVRLILSGLASLASFISTFFKESVSKAFFVIGRLISNQFRKIFLSIFAKFGEFLEKNKTLAKVIEKIGLGGIARVARKAREELKRIDSEASKLTFGKVIEDSFSKAVSSAKQASKSISNLLPSTRQFARSVERDISAGFDIVLRKMKEVRKSFDAKDLLGDAGRSFNQFFTDISESIKETPLLEISNKIAGLFSDENIAKLEEGFTKARETINRNITEISSDVGRVSPIFTKDSFLSPSTIKGIKSTMSKTAMEIRKTGEEILAEFLSKLTGMSKAVAARTLAITQATVANLNRLFDEALDIFKGHSKELIIAKKAAAIAQIVINTAVAITKAFADLGPVGGAIQAALLAGIAGMQIAKVVAQRQEFKEGGEVIGPSGVDAVPARLTAGEYVLPVRTVRHYGLAVMEGLRKNIIPREVFNNVLSNMPKPEYIPKVHFATGGLAMPSATQEKTEDREDKAPINIVNLIDPKLFESYLASQEGERMILNVLHSNKNEVKEVLA